MSYIYPSPGVANVQATLTVSVSSVSDDIGFVVPALQDMTINAATDVFTWEQLDSGSKLQIPTTATNSVEMNLVVDSDAFFGRFTTVANEAALPSSGMTVGTIYYATSEASWHRATSATVLEELDGKPALARGVWGLSNDKIKIDFDIYLGDNDDGSAGKTISGSGYVTGLAPTVSAASPVWVSPITITVVGNYTVS